MPNHGRRKDFFQWAPLDDFSKIFLGRGPKVVKFVFSHAKLRKQTFSAEIINIQWRSLTPPPSDAHDPNMCRTLTFSHKYTSSIHCAVCGSRDLISIVDVELFQTLFQHALLLIPPNHRKSVQQRTTPTNSPRRRFISLLLVKLIRILCRHSC